MTTKSGLRTKSPVVVMIRSHARLAYAVMPELLKICARGVSVISMINSSRVPLAEGARERLYYTVDLRLIHFRVQGESQFTLGKILRKWEMNGREAAAVEGQKVSRWIMNRRLD